MKSVLVFCTLAATVCANEFEEDYNFDYIPNTEQFESLLEPPTFIAAPQHFTVEIEDDITFPCDVKNLGDQKLMFRHFLPNGVHRLLYVGDMSLNAKGYKISKTGNSFTLSGIERRHAGNYECRIETFPITQLNHTLNVQYPATVRRVSNQVQRVEKGSSVTLECKGHGNPKAAISWSREQGHLPSGAQSEEGSSLTFHNVDRHVEGTYICTASNGIGSPDSTNMNIEVDYEPEIITEQATLHKDEGNEAKLLCIVHGRPSPDVSWTKDGKPLNSNTHIQEHDGAHRHTLTVTHVKEEDFGNYTCTASNTYGVTQQTLRITGVPKTPRITSSPAGGERFVYTITWHTESYTPITQYRVSFRKSKANMPSSILQHQRRWKDSLYSPPTSVGPLALREASADPVRSMSHTLLDLDPATDYEVQISVENKFGWSDMSKIFHFNTRKEMAVGQSASRSHRWIASSVILLSTSILNFLQ